MEANLLEQLVVRALGRELREQLTGGLQPVDRPPAPAGPQLIADLSDRLYRLQTAVEDANQAVRRVETVLQELQQSPLAEGLETGGGQKGQGRVRRRLGGAPGQ